MPTIFNPKRRNAIFINTGGTVSPSPAPPSFNNTKSLLFDGVDEYILAPQPFLNSAYVFSFSFWAKKPTATDQINVGDRISTYEGIWLNWYSDGNVYYSVRRGANESMSYALSFDTDWHHFVGTFDNGLAKLYIDGSLVDTFTFSTSFLPATTGDDFRIGAIDGTLFGNGNIDELGTWNIALGLTEITELYNSGTPIALDTDTGNYISSSDLQAWYRNGDNSTYKLPQILMPENTNKDKVSNYSFSYDGVDDYVDTGINTGTDDVTICCWIKTTTTYAYTDTQCAFGGRNNGSGDNYTLGRLGSAFSTPNDTVVRVFNTLGTTKLNDGNWHFIAYTYDYTTKEVKAYVDGNTTPEVTFTIAGWSTYFPISIGNNGNTFYFTGNVDECAYFNSVLTGIELNTIYNSGTPTTITGATAHWKLGEEAKFTDNWLVPNSALSNYSKFSFAFDGVDDSISTGYSYDASVTPNLSISFWFKSTSASLFKFPICIQTSDGGYTTSIVMMYGDNLLIADRSGWVHGTNQDINDGNWHNVIVTAVYSGNTTDGTLLNMYLDGNLTPDLTSANMGTGTASYLDGDLYIGSFNGASNFYDCSVDEVAVWESILTSGNITSIYNSGTPTDLTSLSPVGWWQMGENASFNTNWSIPDQVGSNDGTSANMTIQDLQGEAPNYSGSGISNAMTIEDRVGDAPNSDNNAVSYNMESTDIDNDTP